MTCYNGRFLSSAERARCTPEELKTCIFLNDYSKESDTGGGLFLIASHEEARAPQGVRVNSSMYGFVPWAREKASKGSLTEEDVHAEYRRRQAMVNVAFSENYETCPLNHKHYVTLVATRKFKGTQENPVELIADYDHDEQDGLPDCLTQALEHVTEDEGDGDGDDGANDPSADRVVIFLVVPIVVTASFFRTNQQKRERESRRQKRRSRVGSQRRRRRRRGRRRRRTPRRTPGCFVLVICR